MPRAGLLAALSLGLSACSTGPVAEDPGSCAVLQELEDVGGGAQRVQRIVCGAPVAQVEAWVRALETKAPAPRGLPGHTMDELDLGRRTDNGGFRSLRGISIYRSVPCTFDRLLTPEDLTALHALFVTRGALFTGEIQR
jgi:hypothetical protein